MVKFDTDFEEYYSAPFTSVRDSLRYIYVLVYAGDISWARRADKLYDSPAIGNGIKVKREHFWNFQLKLDTRRYTSHHNFFLK